MTAFRDLVGTQVYSFTPLAIKMNAFLCVCVCAGTHVCLKVTKTKCPISAAIEGSRVVFFWTSTYLIICNVKIAKNEIFSLLCVCVFFLHPPVQTLSAIFRHPLSGLFDLSGTVDCWLAETRLKIKPQPWCWAFILVKACCTRKPGEGMFMKGASSLMSDHLWMEGCRWSFRCQNCDWFLWPTEGKDGRQGHS